MTHCPLAPPPYLRFMKNALTLFPPSNDSAQARLAAFAPKSGSAYARLRNFDHGPEAHTDVSTLSPYVRARALDEIDVVRAVLDVQSEQAAEKFIAEVFWRTYWKGWMELRPSVWDSYCTDLGQLEDNIATQGGLRTRWEEACLGQTGIAPFDAWAHELVQTGYLHNHARMWFASIWIFTLELPWQLGADFFLRHLLDGDVAVNTLSWRWVAGIQTPGKTYLARESNIAKFTDGRFTSVPQLAAHAPPLGTSPPVAPRMLPGTPTHPLPERYGILLHEDDVDAARLLRHAPGPVTFGYLDRTERHSPWNMAPHVSAFRRALAQDMVPEGVTLAHLKGREDLENWSRSNNLQQIVTAYAPVGPTARFFERLAENDSVPQINVFRRPLDTAAWPLATKGFFPFRKNIPDLVADFVKSR